MLFPGVSWRSVILSPRRTFAAVPVTLRIYDKKGVGNFPLKMVVSNLHETGLDLGSGPWTEARNNAATWSSELTTRDYHGRCVLMVYAAATSWHAAPPTTQYITSALSVGHDQVLAGTLDGVITYVLDKYSNSADFPAVAALYAAWTAGIDAGLPDATAALDAGMPDASAPDAAVPGDASMPDAAAIAGDAGGSTPTNGKAGCGCGATRSEGASVAVAALLLGLARLREREQPR